LKYLADTNILCQQDIDPKIRNWVMQHFLSISVSSVTIAEIAQGLQAMPQGKKRRELAPPDGIFCVREQLFVRTDLLATDLGDRMSNVVVLTMSEFGRTIHENGNSGTDHGHATAMFLLGGPVNGGKVLGKWPGLAPEQRYEGRDVAVTTDFRDLFSEVLARHLRAAELDAVFPGHTTDPTKFLGAIKT